MKSSLLVVVIVLLAGSHSFVRGDDYFIERFERQELTGTYYSEGVNIGDINQDGAIDVVHGPFWFAGPEFTAAHEIYPPKPQPIEAYADNFFSWVHDFNRDGFPDVFVVGFPGTPAYVYQSPGKGGFEKHWVKHEVFDWVSNESPHFVTLVGDDQPELVCTRDGHFGYATLNAADSFGRWQFHPISEDVATKRFGHGLGVGDVNGDRRLDVLANDGGFEQPESLDGDPNWEFHKVAFAPAGGAEMYAYDVDGDGDNDVITSLSAHAFGLAWHEQVQSNGQIEFRPHVIMGSTPEENRYGVLFSELHSVNLADIDGDGLKDIVTGKTYWSHHRQSPMWDSGAVVYWFKLVRTDDGVDWLPFKADAEAGIGRQLIVGDVNNDQLPDIVTGGMKGAHVLRHVKQAATEAEWKAAQPRLPVEMAAGLSPEEAARQMTVPDGFRVKLAAGEPQIHQPIAFALDPRGRVWVAEAYTYPERAPEGGGLDKIVILEDTNGDGRLDSRKVFIDGLNLVSGLEVGFGGVWVGAAPYLLFIPEENGDDKPDAEPTVLLDGFGYQDTHETLNAFIWGPDGWLYGCHGVFTHSKVGRPGTPDEQRTGLNAGVWRYHPTRHQFEVFAWGTSNPWGVDFDDHGQAVITACVIPHLWHMIQGGYYQRQGGVHFNPHFYEEIKTIADHPHYVGNIRDHAWWGHEPNAAGTTLLAGGGHAHCGAMIYLGDNWPAKYRHQIFFNNIHGNRINNDVLERSGSGFVGRHGADLLIANDRWYRGINLKYGPDGSVYLIDWYDKNACHRRDPDLWDRTNGRIYNVAYGEPGRVEVDLSRQSEAELVAQHLHSNEWYVRMARRMLQERATRGSLTGATIAGLWEIVRSHPEVPRQLRALWTLHSVGALAGDDLLKLTTHESEYVRAWAVQLELEDFKASPAFIDRLVEMGRSDESPVVRLYLASAMQRLPVEERLGVAAMLVLHGEDVADHNLPQMYWYGIEPIIPAEPAQALRLAKASRIPLITRHIVRRAASDNQTLGAVVAAVGTAADVAEQQLHLDEMLRAFEGRVGIPIPDVWAATYEKLSLSPDAGVRERADQIAVILGDRRVYPRFRELLADAKAEMSQRKRALDILVRGRDEGAVAAFQRVLNVPELRGPALRALAGFSDSGTPDAVLRQYSSLSDDEKRDAITTLVSQPPYALALLSAIEAEKVPRTDLHAFNIRQLLRFNNEALKKRITEVWGEIRESSDDKKAVIAKYRTLLTEKALQQADASNGRRLFTKTCASCHRLFGEGGNVGPDITGSNRANLDYILENIVDPSAVLGKDYRMTIIETSSGRVIAGLVQKETDSAVTVRTLNDTVVVAKSEIDDQRLSDQSIMPERQLDQLQPAEVIDLIGYLGGPAQVPLRGPSAPIDATTGRVAGAVEGESMKILSKSGGSARSQGMGGFTKDRWSGTDHLWWTGAGPGAVLELEVPVEKAGVYRVEVVLTKARDYGIVQLALNGKTLGGPLDLYNDPDVITTGVQSFDSVELPAGNLKLTIQITGANSKAAKGYMVGLDYLRLVAE